MYGAKPLTKESILAYITELDIFTRYEPNLKSIGRLFKSSIREDKHPTCNINYGASGLYYKDFAFEDDACDFIDYMRLKFGLSYKDVLLKLKDDFSLPLFYKGYDGQCSARENLSNFQANSPKRQSIINTSCVISVETRPWTVLDRHFWFDKLVITREDLALFSVYPLKYALIDDGTEKRAYIGGGEFYGFHLGQHEGRELWKLYNPFRSKALKWRTNALSTTLQGFNNLPESGELLIITKSLKDVITLYKAGYIAIAPNSENIIISQEVMENLKKRFNKIVVLYDNDAPGIRLGKSLADTYNLPNFFFNTSIGKDTAEVVENNGYELLKTILLSWNLRNLGK